MTTPKRRLGEQGTSQLDTPLRTEVLGSVHYVCPLCVSTMCVHYVHGRTFHLFSPQPPAVSFIPRLIENPHADIQTEEKYNGT